MTPHETRRLRHEARRRTLTVETVERLTPRMLRIGFKASDLDQFVSASPDDHIKLFFPTAGGSGDDGSRQMRDFTPRWFDIAQSRLVIDFALHDEGPATNWAALAKPGDNLEIGGPRGSVVVPDDFDWYLLIGDESALPAIGRRVEEAQPGTSIATVVVVQSLAEAQRLRTDADWNPTWVVRDGVSDDAALLLRALRGTDLPSGDGFVWIAAETDIVRTIRAYMLDERRHPRGWMRAAGYWTRGNADTKADFEN